MDLKSEIQSAIDEPEVLENIYRQHPKAFESSYPAVLENHPESILLRAWKARLEYAKTPAHRLSIRDLSVMLLLCISAGSLLKIPQWTHIEEFDFYPRYFALIPFFAMFLFTMHIRNWPKRISIMGFVISAAFAAGIFIIPDQWKDVYDLACFNFPFLLWTCYGSGRLGSRWYSSEARIEFLRFTGEIIIHSGLFIIGGAILLLLTNGLFDLLNLPSKWIIDYMAVYGLASIPLVAAWATDTHSAARRMVPLLAQIFSPMLLTLTVVYMAAMALNINELFQDRSALLIYNILLLCVLATAVFTLIGRGERQTGKITSSVTSLMIMTTVILDAIAISAIGWRIQEYGFTANRLAVLGANLVVFFNLGIMGYGYLLYWMRQGSLEEIEDRLGRYLPVYTFWTFFSVFVQPWIFRY